MTPAAGDAIHAGISAKDAIVTALSGASGQSIRAVSEYLGHSDPSFTLRTYTHLMPSSDERTRLAVDSAFATHDATATA